MGPVVIDGAWGTQLQARGLPIGGCPDAWNLSHPDKVEEIAREYVEAGSRIVLTNTFGANRLNLARHALEDKTSEINRCGIELSRRVANKHALVFASVGPSGKMLMSGDVSEEELEAAFGEQIQSLISAGADGIVLETFTDVEEIHIAIAVAKKTGRPVVASMVFDSGKDGDRTMMGVTPEQATKELVEAGADVIGANCGHGIEGFIPICKRLHAATNLPIWIKPNAGMPEMVDGRAEYRTKPAEFAKHVPALVKVGASFIGGCCGTSPDFIRAVGGAIKS